LSKESFQKYINDQHDALLKTIDLFRTLLPHVKNNASVHSGEEGRFIELALMQFLREKLPQGIGAGSGFVIDVDSGWNSRQIDILLYDAATYAPLMKYGDAVVLPVQSVIAAISVKRTLYASQLENEISALSAIGARAGGRGYPKPYLTLVAFDSETDKVLTMKDKVYSAIESFYKPRIDIKARKHLYSWNEMLDSVIVFDRFLVKGDNLAADSVNKVNKYLWTGGKDVNRNIYIQHLLKGIHRAWYDQRRGNKPDEHILAFPKGDMQTAGKLQFCILDRKYVWDKFK